jgi:MoxR-like ATPase
VISPPSSSASSAATANAGGLTLPPRARELEAALAKASYLADGETVLALFLALELDRPLLLEGPAGVGKTELARAAAAALGRPLVRLQCYEGLDEAKALYEWDYAKQMLYTQLLRDAAQRKVEGATSLGEAAARLAEEDDAFFSERFLVARPLLQALRADAPVVLLVDEVDRAEPEFEALLLEVLAERQITIPELGTIRAKHAPLVVLTTNATRDMTDALRRRCLHAALDYPTPSRELAILEARVPGIASTLAASLVEFAQKLRAMDLRKPPSIAETIDWARTMLTLGASALDRDLRNATLGVLLKHQEDRERAAVL